jgi:hypothetical protein
MHLGAGGYSRPAGGELPTDRPSRHARYWALDRAAPVLPLRLGIPEKQMHDYVRHGTTTLFAASEVATGKVADACYPRHHHEEILKFLKQVAKTHPRRKLHIVCDNR